MTIEEFDDIISFAIDREHEAAKFYAELQTMAKFSAQKVMLKELESMELGHAVLLEDFRRRGLPTLSQPVHQVPNLKISEYLVDKQPSSHMNYQDILTIAMKREERANALYADMSKLFADSEFGAVLTRLAAEEAGHKLRFEQLYDEEILKGN